MLEPIKESISLDQIASMPTTSLTSSAEKGDVVPEIRSGGFKQLSWLLQREFQSTLRNKVHRCQI